MANDDRLKDLFSKYIDNRCSPEEVEELFAYFHTDDQHVLQQLVLDEIRETTFAEESENDEAIERVLVNLQTSISADRRKIRPLWPRIAAAAASVIILLSISYYFVIRKPDAVESVAGDLKKDIKPGGNKAFLILGDGRRVSLSDAKNGAIAFQSGKTVNKAADGKIIYGDAAGVNGNAEMVFNTVETPRGGQYQVTLADGTVVFLNAESSIKYPAHFAGKYRTVQLSGEAYFEVAKDKDHPFIVSTAKQDVTVLGTHFDISAYNDEAKTVTTLLEGKVQVTGNTDGKHSILAPGQQSVLTNNELTIGDGDTEEALAWKKGYFMFNNEDLQSIMRKVSRWYDVEIVYVGKIPPTLLYGTINRFSSVEQVLQKLELTGEVHFKIEGRRIMVSK